MTILIAGAGMAGLLAANLLRGRQVTILERQSALPNNHHAVLRFRSRSVSDETGIPFRQVRVFKSCDEPDPVKAGVLYAHKVLGRYEMRSALKLEAADRFIAPPDFISRMSRGQMIRYRIDAAKEMGKGAPFISTMPMSALMDALDYPGPRPAFRSSAGWTIKARIQHCDLFVTRYVTSPDMPFYRVSVTGDELMVEGVGHPPPETQLEKMLWDACGPLGISPMYVTDITCHPSQYAKLISLSPEDRRAADDFIFWATITHGVYSLGRFATWRPGLLLDDLVNDIRKIERWIDSPRYEVHKDR